ncbi:MAG TPA: RNA polymerase sigma factor [Candidatus Baltobacteraceae bacterium]|nr:RNA polymerase sigma factor [Candidatus Baltobacteraceae bacterium]
MDGAGFGAVVSTHHEEIHRYLRRMIGRQDGADDLSQETFLRAYRAYQALPSDANVRAWLFSIATNLAKNHYRAETRRRRAYAELRTAESQIAGSAEAEAAAREAGRVIESIVGRLPLKQRAAFTQRKIHGLEYEEIGQSLGCSAESARAHVFQALKKVRQALGSHGLLPGEFTS